VCRIIGPDENTPALPAFSKLRKTRMYITKTNALSVSHREHDFRLTSGRVAKLTKSIYLCLLIVSVEIIEKSKICDPSLSKVLLVISPLAEMSSRRQ
jgi:hypothetical protein